MFWLSIGIVIGLLLGWNLLPQPAVVKRLYDRAYVRIMRWIMRWIMSLSLIIACVSLAGCSDLLGITDKPRPYPWKQRIVAEIALASIQTSPTPAPDEVKVGDKCPDCNDPPGACGVGRVGDGRVCDRCTRCQGDGRIDDADLRSDAGQSVVEVQKEIVLHVTRSTQKAWANDWYTNERKAFEEAGWFVRFILEPDNSIAAAYFDVVAPDGEVLNFFEPLTLEMLEHLETRQ